jgi:CheY-like chemotaxis protein
MKKHILVIDECRLMRYGLKKALSRGLIEVDTAYTVSYAVTAFGSSCYDLCLFDVCPPVAKGFELMGVIKNVGPDMKIILMTTNDITASDDADEIIDKAKTNGARHLLCKPFDLKLMKDVVCHTMSEDCGEAWFREHFLIRDKRMAKRKSWCKTINYSSSVIKDGEIKRLNFPAESVNMSEDGIELITACLLKPAEIVSFDDELGRKDGRVIWSSQLADQRYAAGIQFA